MKTTRKNRRTRTNAAMLPELGLWERAYAGVADVIRGAPVYSYSHMTHDARHTTYQINPMRDSGRGRLLGYAATVTRKVGKGGTLGDYATSHIGSDGTTVRASRATSYATPEKALAALRKYHAIRENPIDWSGYASTAADYARKGADAARRGYRAAVPHVTRAARATGRATVAAAKATARGARKAAKATARTAAPTLRGWMDRAEKWGRSNPSGPDPLLTDLAVMPIGHSTTRADRVITRWRDGYELDTWNRGPVRSLAETVAILRSDPRWARKNKPRR